MKNYEMRLHQEPFEMIEKGIKNIEYRLNDEKRQQIKIGDTITFYKRPIEKEVLKVKVINLKCYKNLFDMYKDSFDDYLKNYYQSLEEAVINTTYYTAEEIKKYGCVAIYFEKIIK